MLNKSVLYVKYGDRIGTCFGLGVTSSCIFKGNDRLLQNNSKILAAHELEIAVGFLHLCIFRDSEQKAFGLIFFLFIS